MPERSDERECQVGYPGERIESNSMQRTLDGVRHEGLEALRERLGRADMIRFLQQFELGRGDHAEERRQWADGLSLEKIERMAGE